MYGTSDEMPDANTCSIRSLDRHQPIDRFVWCSRNASGTSRASCDMAHRCPQLEFWSPQEFHHIFGCFQFHKKQTSAKSWTPWTFSTVHLISKSFCSPVLCCSLSLGRPTSPPICQWLFLQSHLQETSGGLIGANLAHSANPFPTLPESKKHAELRQVGQIQLLQQLIIIDDLYKAVRNVTTR